MTPAEERAERVANCLHSRDTKDSIPRLLLAILAEEIKIHRLHMQERVNQVPPQGCTNQGHEGRWHFGSGRDRLRDRRNGLPAKHQQRDKRQQHRHDLVTENQHTKSSTHLTHMMSGGVGPSGTPISTDPSAHKQQYRRSRRSPPVGPPPTYKPKPNLTLGFASHVKECLNHEKERREKDARKKERRARGTLEERREAKRKTKDDARRYEVELDTQQLECVYKGPPPDLSNWAPQGSGDSFSDRHNESDAAHAHQQPHQYNREEEGQGQEEAEVDISNQPDKPSWSFDTIPRDR